MHKLAIVGSHPDTRELAPYADPEYDIWGFNEACQQVWMKRWDACMQMHREISYASLTNWVRKDHWEWLQTDHGPGKVIWMQEYDCRVPNSQKYPLAEIVKEYPAFAPIDAAIPFFTSTASYAVALAMFLGYREVEVYGVELSSNTEWSYQLENWLYTVGVAKGAGVNLILRSGQMHFKDRLYAYEGEIQIEREWFAARAKSGEAAWEESEKTSKILKGKLDTAMLDKKYDRIIELVSVLREQLVSAGELSGAMEEARRYSIREDAITRQEYERRAARAQIDLKTHEAAMYHAGGKLEYVFNVWKQTNNYTALQQLRQFAGEQMKAAYDTGAHSGIIKENQEYMIQFDDRLNAAGGQRVILAQTGQLEGVK